MSLGSAPELESRLLGRSEELSVLSTALEAARAGRGGLALVSGDAGIGKSALVDEVQRRAEAQGFRVTTGRAWEFADAPPWFALRGCVRSLGLDPEKLAGASDEGAFVLWERVLEALSSTTREAPVLWVVEDIHAADLQTLDLLVFLTQPLRALRALVLVTTRPEDPRLTDRMTERLTRMGRDGVDVRLAALSPQLIQRLVERVAKMQVPPQVVEQIIELSAGNPLFVVEYAQALAAARGHRRALSSLPPTVRQVVLERARWLPESTRRTLDAGSVAGREFSAATVAKMLEVTPARVIDELIPALRAGIIDELAPGQFRFSHVLVRDAFYEAIGLGQRSAFHARAAEAFRVVQGSDALISSAQHALKGLPISDAQETAALVDRAVDLLVAQHAHDRAFALSRQCDAARTEGLLPAATSEQLLSSVGLARAAGRFVEARAIATDLLGRARAEKDSKLLAQTALALGAALQPGLIDRVLVDALTEARDSLPETEAKLLCLVRARLAAALQPAPDPNEPVAMALEVIEDARELGDPELLREVLFFAGSAVVDFAPAEIRLRCAEELLELSERTGDRARALHATIRLGVEHTTGGDFAAATRDVERALTISDELGRAPRYRWRPLLLSSMLASACGRFDESERAIVEVTQLQANCDDPALSMALFAHQSLTARLQRRDREVEALLPEMRKQLGDAPLAEPMYALMRLSFYSRVEDEAKARAILPELEPHIDRYLYDPDFCGLVAEGLAFVGSNELRTKLRARLDAGAPELSMGHIIMVYEGPARRAIALLDAALGETNRALDALEASRQTARARGHRTWVAQIDYDIGKVLERMNRVAEATAHFERAATLAEELGIDGLAQAARLRLGRVPEPNDADSEEKAKELSMTLEGDAWRVRYGNSTLSIKDTRGMQLLARLVERPGEEIHALVLSGDEGASLSESHAGDHLDETAKRAYKRRLSDLEAEIDKAEADADGGRLEKLRDERGALVQELSRALGMGGRARQAGSATERARVNVRKRLKQAISSLEKADTGLGHYLTSAVRTGAFCSFRP